MQVAVTAAPGKGMKSMPGGDVTRVSVQVATHTYVAGARISTCTHQHTQGSFE
jgi:hypothetical protein